MSDPHRPEDESQEDAPEHAGDAQSDVDARPAGDGDGEQPEAPPDEAAAGEAPEPDASAAGGSGDGEDDAAPREPRRAGRAFAITVLVLVLLAMAGGGGWAGWRLYQLEQRVTALPDEREQALAPLARRAALDDAVSGLRAEIERLESAGSSATEALAERVARLEDAVATVRELAGRSQVDWRMAEVHYLLSVAARRLAIAGDRTAAVAALEAADRSLAALGDVRLVELRRAIVDDITAIRQVEPADVEGIALRVQSLLQRIPRLPAAPAEAATPAGDGEDGGPGGVADWWAAVKERLSRFVVIQRQPDGDGPPRPRPDTALPGAERLAFALAEARRAALRHESDAYDAAIARARRELEAHFAIDAPVTQRFASDLAALAERPVTTDYPDLTATLERAERAAARLRTLRERQGGQADEEADQGGDTAADGEG